MIDKEKLIEDLVKEEQRILNVASKSRLSLIAYTGPLLSLAFGILKDTLFKGKTEEEIKEILWMWYATSHPHSRKCGEEWEEYKNKGLLDEAVYWESGVYISDICPNTIPRPELVRMVNQYYQTFLKSPRYIMKQIWLTIKSSYRRNVVINNLNRIGTIRNVVNNLTSHQYTIS